MTKLIFPFIWLLACHFNHAQFLSQKNDLEKFEGFFDYYYDKNEDKIYLEVEQTEKEFLYVHYLSQGIGSNDIELDRGQLGGGVIVKFIKSGNKLLLIQPNLRFRASTDNEAEKRSVEEAFAKSVLYGFEILEERDGMHVINITDFFIRDAHGVALQLKNKQQGAYSLDKNRSSFNMKRTKAFPKNIEIDVLLTYGGNASGREI